MHLKTYLLFLVLVMPVQAGAETYQWTNSNGSIGITDDPGQVPAQYREQAMKKAVDGSQGSISYSRPSEKDPSSTVSDIHESRKKPEQRMTDEEKKKADREIREVWENMKKSLGGNGS